MSVRRVLCVVGPTAVGKSALAELVAREVGGAIVSMDSMQVYRGMDIGTAKSAPGGGVVLHMVDVAEVGEPYSVAMFQRDARRCIDGLLARDTVPVLCGGTGLYLDAVVDEMEFPHGETGGARRAAYEELARTQGEQALHDLLRERDPKSAALVHPHNVRRVARALEMLDEGSSYAEQHKGLKARKPHYHARLWALTMPRDMLYEAIDRRVDQMFEEGLVREVEGLVGRGLTPNSTAGQAIGYKEVLLALKGEVSMDGARELIKRNTRRYAKRQLSWIRRDGRARWVDVSQTTLEEACGAIADDWRTS